MKDYYQILGVPQRASADDVRRRYRFLAQAYHPDKFPDPENKAQAEAEFKVVQEAYRVLSSPGQRAAYDRTSIRHAERPGEPRRRPTEAAAGGVEEARRPVGYLRRRTLGLSVAQWLVVTVFLVDLIVVRDPLVWDELILLLLVFTIDPILSLLGY